MPQAKSKFIYFYEHISGDRSYDYNSLVDGVKPFDSETAAKQYATNEITNHSENVYGDFEVGDWTVYIAELTSVTTYKTRREGIQLDSPKKLV